MTTWPPAPWTSARTRRDCSTWPAPREPRTTHTGSAARPSETAASPAVASRLLQRRLVAASAGAQAAADLGGDPGPVRPARHARGQRLPHLAHALHVGRAGFGDGRGDQLRDFVVAELGGEVFGQDVSLGSFGRRLLRPSRLPALPGLAGEHLHDLLVAQVTGRSARYLLVRDRGQRHPQGAQPDLIARPYRVVQVRAQPVFQFSHTPILGTGPRRRAVSACPAAWHHGTVRLRTLIPATAALGAAAVGYATVIERNWFVLRRYEVPVVPPGSAPLRVLHISDTHLTPGRQRLMAWVRALDELDPHRGGN